MVSHYIILSSSYSKGKRIGMDFIINSQTEQDIIKTRNEITDICGGDSISIHLVHAKDEKWSSLCKADSYFSDVEVIKDVDKLLKSKSSLFGEIKIHSPLLLYDNLLFALTAFKLLFIF